MQVCLLNDTIRCNYAVIIHVNAIHKVCINWKMYVDLFGIDP